MRVERLPGVDVLPEFHSQSRQIDIMPEKRLLVAIIQRALVDYSTVIEGKTHLHTDAARWLFSASLAPWGLYWICEYLSDSPAHLQRSIQRVARRGLRSHTVVMRVDTK